MANDLKSSLKLNEKEMVKCRKAVEVTLDAEAMKRESDRAASEFANYVAVPGFRKGKAPVGMLKTKYADDIKQELGRRVISAAFDEITKDKNLDILSYSLDSEPKIEFDQEFKFTLNLDIAPEIELGEYKNMEVSYEKKEVSDKEVDDRLNLYRTMYANYVDVAGEAQAEDMLKVSYTSDFVLPEDASAYLKRQVESDNNFVWLKEPESIPGSIAALTGVKAGESRSFEAVYPADFREAALAGKTVKYDVKVESVQRRGELTDAELCEKIKAPSIEEFKTTLKLSLENEVAGANNSKLLEVVGDKLDSLVKDFELPEAVVNSEAGRELQKMAEESVKSEADADTFKKDLEKHRAEAEVNAKKAVRRKLILRKIAKIENISVSDKEVDQQIASMSQYYGYKPGELRALLVKNGTIDELQFSILSAKVLQFLADNAKK